MEGNMQKEIFILEDDKHIGFILNHILFEEGYRVKVYDTISSFRAALGFGSPDLLLMDVRLPDGNGMELCAELKTMETFRIPILMMSADWHLNNKDQCRADGYIVKPFDVEQVVSKVAAYFQAG
jgi:DNA-binding response OmpR family regulator